MTPPDLNVLLPVASRIARQAGDAILEIYKTDFDVTTKADTSPLTEADLASQRRIAELARLTPEIPLLSEESAEVPYATRRTWRSFWLVDPLDGTKEFVKRNGEFTVNIALIEGGRPVLGVVHAPDLNLTYAAADGHGASRWEGDAEPEPIRTSAPESGRLTVVASRSHSNEASERFLERLRRDHPVDLTSKGSSLKICLVAEGSAHLYPRIGPTMEWDTAAAQVILEEAGGVMIRLDGGGPLRYNKEDLRNPHFVVAYGAAAPGMPT